MSLQFETIRCIRNNRLILNLTVSMSSRRNNIYIRSLLTTYLIVNKVTTTVNYTTTLICYHLTNK